MIDNHKTGDFQNTHEGCENYQIDRGVPHYRQCCHDGVARDTLVPDSISSHTGMQSRALA